MIGKFNIKNIVTMINKMMGSFFELDLKRRENGIRFRISLPLNDVPSSIKSTSNIETLISWHVSSTTLSQFI